jgi:hypothetical protein
MLYLKLDLPVLDLTFDPFELCFGCKPSGSHLRHDNLDKFESRSSDGILLGYTAHDKSYRMFNLETNTVVESCDVM